MSGSRGDVSGVATVRRQTISCSGPSDTVVSATLTELLRRTHLSAPSELAAVVANPVRRIGAQDFVLYPIDYEQRTLVPLRGSHAENLASLSATGPSRSSFGTT
jgi:hypothetical protein